MATSTRRPALLLLLCASAHAWLAAVTPGLRQYARLQQRSVVAVASPFESGKPGTADADADAELAFTVENVDAVLEEVRPYLISDGGNVAVHAVDPESMSVQLVLQGACGSCESSTTTMKMGIERVLRENWEGITEVTAVEPKEELNTETAMQALEQIMPAVTGLGGKVEILSAAQGKVTLEYSGPDKIRFGIELALKDNPLIDEVEFESPA